MGLHPNNAEFFGWLKLGMVFKDLVGGVGPETHQLVPLLTWFFNQN